jgi:hypothetical protein
MANSNGWGDGAGNNAIGWGQGANNSIGWGDSHAKSWAGLTDIVGITTDPAASAFIAAAGITGATQQLAIDNLVKGLKADGIYSKMKAVYPFVTDIKNVFIYTEDFSNAYWFKNALSISSNTINAPNGTLTADSIVENTANTGRYIGVGLGLSLTAAPYTMSVYLKKANRDWFSLGLFNGVDSKTAWFNLNTGTIGTIESGITASISDAGNGWYRCSVTRTMSGVLTNYLGMSPTLTDGGVAYLGNGTTASYIWGAQIELGSTATTYQPIATTQQAYISNQFKYNLINPVDSDAAFRLVFNGGWTHSSTGATPNGTNGYADTKLVPSAQFTSGNNSSGIYIRTENTNAGALIGTQSSGNSSTRNWMFVRLDGSNYHEIRNNTSLITSTTSPATSQGYWMNNRITTAQQKMFRNGSSIASSNHTENANFSTVPFFISCQNNNGSAAEYSNRQLSFAHIGNGLTDTDAANLYTRVQAFQTALNRQV